MWADYFKTGFSVWLRRVHEFTLGSGKLWKNASLVVSPGHCHWVWRGVLALHVLHVVQSRWLSLSWVVLASWVCIIAGLLTATSLHLCPHLRLTMREWCIEAGQAPHCQESHFLQPKRDFLWNCNICLMYPCSLVLNLCFRYNLATHQQSHSRTWHHVQFWESLWRYCVFIKGNISVEQIMNFPALQLTFNS